MMATKCAPAGVGLAVLEALGEGDHQALHLVGVVLTDELEVHAVLAHHAAGGRLLAAGGEHHAHLRVPRPVIEANLRLVAQPGPASARASGAQAQVRARAKARVARPPASESARRRPCSGFLSRLLWPCLR